MPVDDSILLRCRLCAANRNAPSDPFDQWEASNSGVYTVCWNSILDLGWSRLFRSVLENVVGFYYFRKGQPVWNVIGWQGQEILADKVPGVVTDGWTSTVRAEGCKIIPQMICLELSTWETLGELCKSTWWSYSGDTFKEVNIKRGWGRWCAWCGPSGDLLVCH